MTKFGKIIPNGVYLEKHENNTVVFLTQQGFDVTLIPRSQQKGMHSPDVIINGIEWEIKSPKGKGRWLLENTLRKATRQSPNVIIDLQRIHIHEQKCLRELEKQFFMIKNIKHLRIITKRKEIIAFDK